MQFGHTSETAVWLVPGKKNLDHILGDMVTAECIVGFASSVHAD